LESPGIEDICFAAQQMISRLSTSEMTLGFGTLMLLALFAGALNAAA